MTIRIDTDSFKVEKTKHAGIFRITATITQDDPEVTEPELHTVSVLWNKTSGLAKMGELLEAAIPVPDTPFETAVENFKATYTEALVTTPEPSTEPVNQVVSGNLIIQGNMEVTGTLTVNGTVIQ